ncbi:MAG: KdsC family phosphatase [Wujia sp.]
MKRIKNSTKIKYLVMDVDGTLTDGKIYMGNDGELFKAFSAKDGYGICHMAVPAGIEPIIITGRSSAIVENRCKELGIKRLYQGITDKLKCLEKIFLFDGFESVAYIGDDLNDLSCMEAVSSAGGLTGCPADASDAVIDLVDYVTDKNGGEGAVREFIEWILEM